MSLSFPILLRPGVRLLHLQGPFQPSTSDSLLPTQHPSVACSGPTPPSLDPESKAPPSRWDTAPPQTAASTRTSALKGSAKSKRAGGGSPPKRDPCLAPSPRPALPQDLGMPRLCHFPSCRIFCLRCSACLRPEGRLPLCPVASGTLRPSRSFLLNCLWPLEGDHSPLYRAPLASTPAKPATPAAPGPEPPALTSPSFRFSPEKPACIP